MSGLSQALTKASSLFPRIFSQQHRAHLLRQTRSQNSPFRELQSIRSLYYRSQTRFAQATAPSPTPTGNDPAEAVQPLETTTNAANLNLNESDPSRIDWSKSFHGMSTEAFPKEAADILLEPINADWVEIKPDGIVYLPEIHYRRILNRAFGPGAWGLAPRSETMVTDKAVTREYALLAHGRLVSIARGEQDYFNKDGVPTASEGCKSNAMVRCCKDLGIASELWDPRYIRQWKSQHAREAFVEHQVSKKRTKIWLRKGDPVQYPFKETNSKP